MHRYRILKTMFYNVYGNNKKSNFNLRKFHPILALTGQPSPEKLKSCLGEIITRKFSPEL
jgi:hypothetical protein